MKLIVTGGLGFIGSRFSLLALTQGHEVKILDSETYAADRKRLGPHEGEFEIVVGDIGDSELVSRVAKGFDAIVNFAAESHNDNAITGPEKFFDTNASSVLKLAKIAVTQDLHFHQVSTDEVFGDTPRDSADAFVESSPLRPSNPYSASKAAAEHVVRSWGRTFGMRWSISNCSNNYGPGQHEEKLIPRSFALARAGKPIELYGDGGQIRDWIHVDDHCRGVLMQLEKGHQGTLLFGARDEQTNLSIAGAILTSQGKTLNGIVFVKDRAGHDQRYAIEPSLAEEILGWMPANRSVLEWIGQVGVNAEGK